MYVVESGKYNTRALLFTVLLLLFILFIIWLLWLMWSSHRIDYSQTKFTVYTDKSANIKPSNGYVERLAFCAREATTVTVTINLHNQTQPIVETIQLTPDVIHWWQLTLSQHSNFSSVNVASSAGAVDVIAQVVTTNLCDCKKKKCDSACGTSTCDVKKKKKKHHKKCDDDDE